MLFFGEELVDALVSLGYWNGGQLSETGKVCPQQVAI